MYKKISYLLCLVFVSLSLNAQEPLVEKFIEDRKATSLFLYQSTLRMFNEQESNEDFDKLIKDLELMRLYILDQKVEKSEFKALFRKITKENYESVMEVDSKEFTLRLFVKEKGRKTSYVLGLITEDGTYLADMKGSLNLEYLSALNNQSWLKNAAEIIPQKKSN